MINPIFAQNMMTMSTASTLLMANAMPLGVDLLTPKIDSFHYEGPIDPLLCSATNETNGQGGGVFARAWKALSRKKGPKAAKMSREDSQKLEELAAKVHMSGEGSGKISFRSLPDEGTAVELYYRHGQGFALVPTIRGAKVSIWRDQEEPIVARRGKFRWLRDGDHVQIALNQKFIHPERTFAFKEPTLQAAYHGGHRYPGKVPDYFQQALRELQANPKQPSRIVDENNELLGFLSYSPTLGYCLQPWMGQTIRAITHQGARSTQIEGPVDSNRLERDMIDAFVLLDSFDLIQFGEREPFEISYAKSGSFAFNGDVRTVRRAQQEDYEPFVQAVGGHSRVSGGFPYSVKYRKSGNRKYFEVVLLSNWDQSIQYVPRSNARRTKTLSQEGDRLRIPLDAGYPIIQFGTADPVILNMNWLSQLAGMWAAWRSRRDDPLSDTLNENCEILGVAVDADKKTVWKAYRKKLGENHPDKVHGDAEAEAEAAQNFMDVKAAYKVICAKKGWEEK